MYFWVLGVGLRVNGGWISLPTLSQRYCDPASLVYFLPLLFLSLNFPEFLFFRKKKEKKNNLKKLSSSSQPNSHLEIWEGVLTVFWSWISFGKFPGKIVGLTGIFSALPNDKRHTGHSPNPHSPTGQISKWHAHLKVTKKLQVMAEIYIHTQWQWPRRKAHWNSQPYGYIDKIVEIQRAGLLFHGTDIESTWNVEVVFIEQVGMVSEKKKAA